MGAPTRRFAACIHSHACMFIVSFCGEHELGCCCCGFEKGGCWWALSSFARLDRLLGRLLLICSSRLLRRPRTFPFLLALIDFGPGPGGPARSYRCMHQASVAITFFHWVCSCQVKRAQLEGLFGVLIPSHWIFEHLLEILDIN